MEHSVVARAQVLDVQCFQVDLRFFELLPHFFQLCLIIHFKLNVTFFGLHHTKTKFINMSSQCHRLQSLTNTIRSVSRVSCYCCSTTSTTSGNLIPIFVCSCTQFIMPFSSRHGRPLAKLPQNIQHSQQKLVFHQTSFQIDHKTYAEQFYLLRKLNGYSI